MKKHRNLQYLIGLWLFASSIIISCSDSSSDGESKGGTNTTYSLGYFIGYDGKNHSLRITDGTAEGTRTIKTFTDGNSIEDLTPADDGIYFIHDDGVHYYELWYSDGTEAGTTMVKDILPGADTTNYPQNLIYFKGKVYFAADDGIHGLEYWQSDGTEAGTTLLKDINVGDATSHSFGRGGGKILATDDRLFFVAMTDDGTYGEELWVSDGTTAGTNVIDISPGSYSTSFSTTDSVANATHLYFAACDATCDSGEELWISNGTSAGTYMLKDINPSGISSVQNLTPINGKVYFYANDGSHDYEPWVTDGTETGTHLVKDIRDGDSSQPSRPEFIAFGDHVYFNADDGSGNPSLWKTDDSSAGTVRLNSTANDSTEEIILGSTAHLTATEKALFFYGDIDLGGTPTGTGQELWISDGTEAGTHILKDINAGTEDSNLDSFYYPYGKKTALQDYRFFTIGQKIVFIAKDETNGRELWVSDGTTTGTVMIENFNIAGEGSAANSINTIGGNLYYQKSSSDGYQLWISDGSEGGTSQLTTTLTSSVSQKFIEAAGGFFFAAMDSTIGTELWFSDGTPEGSNLVKDINPSGNAFTTTILEAGSFQNKLFFQADDGTAGQELWVSDGTETGTSLFKELNTTPGGSSGVANFTAYGDRLFFWGRDGADIELWASDGSADNTVLFKDINPGDGAYGGPSRGVISGDKLFFSAITATDGRELWVTDGTADNANTFMLKDIYSGTGTSNPMYLTDLNGTLYFFADDGSADIIGLWKTNGTTVGTTLVKALDAVSINYVGGLTAFDNKLFFYVKHNSSQDLWSSDGTEEGTAILKDIFPGGSPRVRELTPAGSNLFFIAEDGVHGQELWKTDGTLEGTAMVKDIMEGSGSSFTSTNWPASGLDGILYFSATDGYHGYQLWRSDGTETGTYIFQETSNGDQDGIINPNGGR